MGNCKDCHFAAPDEPPPRSPLGPVYRCIHPVHHWTFRVAPEYGCDHYRRPPDVLLEPRPRRSAEALKAAIRETLGPHYLLRPESRMKAQQLSDLWRAAVEFEREP